MSDLSKFHDKKIEKGEFDPIVELSVHGFSRTGKKPEWVYKNHRKWTEEEITANIIKELGEDVGRPLGYKILVKGYTGSEFQAQERIESELVLQHKGLVLDMGDEAFLGGAHSRFPNGGRVAIGDWVSFRCYERQLHTVKDEEGRDVGFFGLVDDDKIDLIIKEPEQVHSWKI